MEDLKKSSNKRRLTGVVVSDKNSKTIVVKVIRKFKHGTYPKFIHRAKKYHAHDESCTAKLNDNVTIIESKPHSKLKKWELLKVNA
jgi:small subunit ribosomal protein S17